MNTTKAFSHEHGNTPTPAGNQVRLVAGSFLVFVSVTVFNTAVAVADEPFGILPKPLGTPDGCAYTELRSLNNGSYSQGLRAVGGAHCPNAESPLEDIPMMWQDGSWAPLQLPEGNFTQGWADGITASPEATPSIVYYLLSDGQPPVWGAWVLTLGHAPVRLTPLAEADNILEASISAQGNHVVGIDSSGDSESGRIFRAVRWTREGEGWSVPEDIAPGRAVGVSADGKVVIGNGDGESWAVTGGSPWVWTEGDELVQLATDTRVYDITDSGTTIVGSRAEPCAPEWGCDFYELPAYWIEEDGQWTMHGLQSLDDVDSGAVAVAEIQGKPVILGWGFSNPPDGFAIQRAVVWLPAADGSYGAPNRLEALGGNFDSFAWPNDINNSGTVLGWSEYEPWGKTTDVIWSLTDALPFRINAGITDAWFNPESDGQGFFIMVWENIETMFVGWFTYNDDSQNAPNHYWLTAQGPISDNRAELEVTLTDGGAFDAGQPAPTRTPDGTMTVEFSNCAQGTVTYDIPSIGRQGSVPVRRLVGEHTANCERLSAAGSD